MKKIIIAIAFLFSLSVAEAATINILPSSIEASKGQSFSMAVMADPQSDKGYTVKLELSYPADLLEVVSFSFADKWLPLSVSGYDLVDNITGDLVKTAGYPGGFASAAKLGTIVFKSKKVGQGSINIGSGAAIFNADNKNILSGTMGIPIKINLMAIPQVSKPKTPVTSEGNATVSSNMVLDQQSLPAALGAVLSLGTGNVAVAVLLSIIIIAIFAYAVFAFATRKKRNL